MRRALVLSLTAGVAAGVSATGAEARQASHGFARFEVAASQAGPWAGTLSVQPGEAVFVRLVNGWVGTPPVAGWSGTTFEHIRFDGADATDGMTLSEAPVGSPGWYTPDVTGVFTIWKKQVSWNAWSVYNTPTGRKIDHAVNPDTTGRLVMGQPPPGSPVPPTQGFDPTNGAASLYFRFTAGIAPGGARSIRITADWFVSGTPAPTGNHYLVFPDQSGISSKLPGDAATESAMVTIVPAPAGVLVLVGLLAGARRRRRVVDHRSGGQR